MIKCASSFEYHYLLKIIHENLWHHEFLYKNYSTFITVENQKCFVVDNYSVFIWIVNIVLYIAWFQIYKTKMVPGFKYIQIIILGVFWLPNNKKKTYYIDYKCLYALMAL